MRLGNVPIEGGTDAGGQVSDVLHRSRPRPSNQSGRRGRWITVFVELAGQIWIDPGAGVPRWVRIDVYSVASARYDGAGRVEQRETRLKHDSESRRPKHVDPGASRCCQPDKPRVGRIPAQRSDHGWNEPSRPAEEGGCRLLRNVGRNKVGTRLERRRCSRGLTTAGDHKNEGDQRRMATRKSRRRHGLAQSSIPVWRTNTTPSYAECVRQSFSDRPCLDARLGREIAKTTRA